MDVALIGQGDDVVADLAELLLDAVADGASVGFPSSLERDDAMRYWRDALDGAALTWVARLDGAAPVDGVVRLHPALFPNGRHRAEVAKLLVHRRARDRGVARALMAALEAEAQRRGRWLLVLDTRTGSPAEAVYERWGWQRIGVVHDFAATPDGALAPTTFLTKRLARVD